MPRVRHLFVLAAVATLWLLGTDTVMAQPASTQADAKPPRIASANWTTTETLIALGVTPYGVSDIANYNTWVKEPPVPPSTIDIGLRNQPNLELLAQNPPDLLLSSALFSRDNARLERLMPVRIVDNFYTGQPFYPATQAMTREIGDLTGHQAQAERLIDQTDQKLTRAAQSLADISRPVYVVQFSDTQHVRVFGGGNMVGTVLDRTHLRNAWTGPTNAWGYASISIDRLAETPDARIVVIKPYPRQVESELENNQVWQHLPAVREGRVSEIAPVWPYGGLVSMQRLTRSLVEVMTGSAGAPDA
ncbi:ABC transporter substrate-binding protein [Salinicola rhizosphaerae]|uniref:ABC transporter substrate-binding protein n=1 Tax=Salinicola rhizosphaerae TaxID=1443141 RepID=A0ABQ3E290_9GAMM|nr:ABC transporter substrate-binding protein [Salinicola rhizosphaerae]